MKFILIADDEQTSFFFPLWEVLLFALVIIGILYILYPHDLLQKVLAQDKPSAVTLSYLKAFKKSNQKNPQFIFALIEQEIGMGQLHQAQADIATFKKMEMPVPDNIAQAEWLDYLLLKSKTYKSKINTKKRIIYLGHLREMAQKLSNAPLNSKQLQSIAQDTLSLGKPEIALKIYKRLMKNHLLKTAADFAQGGSIAMQNNAQRDSALFYWAAYNTATKQQDKKHYALSAVKALWAGKFVNEALSLANQLPPDLIKDRSTLLLLSRLALAANNPMLAEKYAIKALLQPNETNHENE
jgi:hypothetical protein